MGDLIVPCVVDRASVCFDANVISQPPDSIRSIPPRRHVLGYKVGGVPPLLSLKFGSRI